MKLSEYAAIHNLKTPEDWKEYFRKNMLTGQVPVALYSCVRCDEIVDIPTAKKCSGCKKEKSISKEPQIPWKLLDKEADEYKKRMVKKLVDKYNISEKEAGESADIWIEAVNAVAKEWGEELI